MGVIFARQEYLRVKEVHRRQSIKRYLAETEGDDHLPRYFRTNPLEMWGLTDGQIEGGGEDEEEEEEEEAPAAPEPPPDDAPAADGAAAADDDDDGSSVDSNDPRERLAPKFWPAVAAGAVDAVVVLLQRRCTVDMEDDAGRSPLMVAAQHGHADLCQLLVQRDADLEATNAVGWTPLLCATFHGHQLAMRALIRRGADIKAQDDLGMSAVHLVCISPKISNIGLVSFAERKEHAKSRKKVFLKQKEDMRKQAQERAGQRGKTAGKKKAEEPFDQLWKSQTNAFELLLFQELFQGAARRNERVSVNARDKYQRTPLAYATRNGASVMASRLIHERADVNAPDVFGLSPLMQAVDMGKLEMVEALLRCRAMVNQADGRFQTPLHHALEHEAESFAQLLLTRGADVNAWDSLGRTPLHVCMEKQNNSMLLTVLAWNPSLDVLSGPGWNVIIYACRHNLLPAFLEVLKEAPEALKLASNFQDRQGMTALHHVCEIQQLEYTQILLRLSADPTKQDCNGNTPLHVACEKGLLDIAQALADHLDQLDTRNVYGETPLLIACRNGNLSIVIHLADEKVQIIPADFSATDNQGRTVLMAAAMSGSLDLMHALLQNKDGDNRNFSFIYMAMNATDHTGQTALSIAAKEGHWQVIPSLVLAKASLTTSDNDGWMALHAAASEGEAATCQTLLDCQHEVDCQDHRGWTPLMMAVSAGHEGTVRTLLEYHADPMAESFDLKTSIGLAAQEQHNARHLTQERLDVARAVFACGMEGQKNPAQRIKDQGEQVAYTRRQIQEVLVDFIGRKKDAKRLYYKMNELKAYGHLMVTVVGCENLHVQGSEAHGISTYVYVAYQGTRTGVVQVMLTSCALMTRTPVWYDNVRFELNGADGFSTLQIFVFQVPNAKNPKGDPLQLGDPRPPKVDTGPKTALDKRIEQAKKNAEKRRKKEEQNARLFGAAGAEMNAHEAETRALTPHERQWLHLRNYCNLVKEQTGVELHMPVVPTTHTPLGCFVLPARQLRQVIESEEIGTFDRGLTCGFGRVKIEVEARILGHKRAQREEEEGRQVPVTPREQDVVDRIRYLAGNQMYDELTSTLKFGAERTSRNESPEKV